MEESQYYKAVLLQPEDMLVPAAPTLLWPLSIALLLTGFQLPWRILSPLAASGANADAPKVSFIASHALSYQINDEFQF